jgi:hypothetical protein
VRVRLGHLSLRLARRNADHPKAYVSGAAPLRGPRSVGSKFLDADELAQHFRSLQFYAAFLVSDSE